MIFKANNVCFGYGKKRVFTNLNFEINSAEVVGIVGRNGCGKTTLLKLVGGFVYPQRGYITYSKTVETGSPYVSGILETPQLYDYMTGDENLRYYLEKQYSKEKAEKTFELWGMGKSADASVKKYSLGMRQKLALMIAFLSDAPLLIFDEPTNSLDFESVKTFYSCVDAAKKDGRSVVIVTHIMYELNKHCSKIYEIIDGGLKEFYSSSDEKNVYIIKFADCDNVKAASEMITGEEIEKVGESFLEVNENERSISEIIRQLDKLDITVVAPKKLLTFSEDGNNEI